jgi:predicted nucleic acid-binding protein
MILLDTNILILALVPDSEEARLLTQWLEDGIPLVTSTIVWYEFQCGPVKQSHIDLARRFLTRVLPFKEREAQLAAELFESSGRKRGIKVDAMIAATAIANSARLATRNTQDFQSFPGLKLVP